LLFICCFTRKFCGFIREFHAFTREFGGFTREFHAFIREFCGFTREFHAFTRKFRTFTREFHAFTREFCGFTRSIHGKPRVGISDRAPPLTTITRVSMISPMVAPAFKAFHVKANAFIAAADH
jgi:hypothetical protein